MSRRPNAAALLIGAALAMAAPACRTGAGTPAVPTASAAPAASASTAPQLAPASPPARTLEADLQDIFAASALRRAVVAARVDALDDGRVLYADRDETLVMPASNMKIVTMAVAAERLGWDFRYHTRIEAAGRIADGVLTGDLVVMGDGDPSIGSHDAGSAELFTEWATAIRRAGISRVEGRLIGDDRAFSGDGLGAGWSWDYLADGYAAPTGALNYNENVAVVHIAPGEAAGSPAIVTLTPPGHGLTLQNDVVTALRGTAAALDFSREPGTMRLVVSGRVPAGAAPIIHTAAVSDPARYFVDALRIALAEQGIAVSGGAWPIAAAPGAPPTTADRVLIAQHDSEPLSSLVEYAMKVSQNFYGETIFRTLGRTGDRPASAESARTAAAATLAGWGVSADAIVMRDGSGLSRYDYVTTSALVAILEHVWHDDRLRGPFVAALPVGAHDGTLGSRMANTVLDRHVQAKTGTITNVRALSGYLETESGEKLAFSIIVNNETASGAEIDALVDKALERLVSEERRTQ